jgi:hypothetical protein
MTSIESRLISDNDNSYSFGYIFEKLHKMQLIVDTKSTYFKDENGRWAIDYVTQNFNYTAICKLDKFFRKSSNASYRITNKGIRVFCDLTK